VLAATMYGMMGMGMGMMGMGMGMGGMGMYDPRMLFASLRLGFSSQPSMIDD
jgi:hypothetical protein